MSSRIMPNPQILKSEILKPRYSNRSYRTRHPPGRGAKSLACAFALDEAVRKAYGISQNSKPLVMLMELNESLAATELEKRQILGPGLPKTDGLKTKLVSSDCCLRP